MFGCSRHWIDQKLNTIMTKSVFVFFQKSDGFCIFLYILVITLFLGDQTAIVVFSIQTLADQMEETIEENKPIFDIIINIIQEICCLIANEL